MNIIFISHSSYPCGIGGMEIFNYHLINELSKKYNIQVLTPCKKYHNPNVVIKRENYRLFGIRRFGFSKIALMLQDIFHILTAKNCDLILISYTGNSEHYSLYFPFIKRFKKIEYVIINHGGGIIEWKYKKRTLDFFKGAKANIAVSEPIKKEYEKRINKEVLVLPPLLPFKKSPKNKNETRKQFGISAESIVILSVGSLKDIKNPIVLLKAFISLGKEYIVSNDLQLYFAGSGPLYPVMKDMISQCEMSSRITLLGDIKNEDIFNYYVLADIYIINSIFEGTPISLLEAMFNKNIIIGSNSRGINQIIQDGYNGLLYDYDNMNMLTEKIRFIIANPELTLSLKENAYNFYLEEYNFEDMILTYQQLIEA